MTSNQRCAIAPNSAECSCIQTSIAGSRLTELGNRRSWLMAFSLGRRPIRAQHTVDVEVVWFPTTHTIAPQATLTDKPAALEQALRPPVIDPDEGVHAIDQVLSVSPLKYCGHGLAHHSLAPVPLRKVVRQLRPAMHLGPLVETAGADKLIIVPESDPPSGQLTRGP